MLPGLTDPGVFLLAFIFIVATHAMLFDLLGGRSTVVLCFVAGI